MKLLRPIWKTLAKWLWPTASLSLSTAWYPHSASAEGKRVNHQSDGSQWTNLEDLIKYMVVVALAEQRPTAKIASADANFANIKLWYYPPAVVASLKSVTDTHSRAMRFDSVAFGKARSRAGGQWC